MITTSKNPHRWDKIIVTAIMVSMFVLLAVLKYLASNG